jgi:hypothetical protein
MSAHGGSGCLLGRVGFAVFAGVSPGGFAL